MAYQGTLTRVEGDILDYFLLAAHDWTCPPRMKIFRDDLMVLLCEGLVVKEMLERDLQRRYRLRGDCGWF